MAYCLYFQAIVKREKVWLFTSILRSCEHLAFDRTLDANKSMFEFFVTEDSQEDFLRLMHYFEKQDLVTMLQQLPNRLLYEDV